MGGIILVNRKILITVILTVALVAVAAAAASALTVPDKVTVKADYVITDGHYVGTTVLMPGEIYHYGYNYTEFVPDGAYSVTGTIKNDGDDPVSVYVVVGQVGPVADGTYLVPAHGQVGFNLYMPAPYMGKPQGFPYDPTKIIGFWDTANDGGPIDWSSRDYKNADDTMSHTIDEGPMSNAVAIYQNGKPINGGVMYSLNMSTDDYKDLYTSGTLNYSGQPAYTIGLY